MARGKKKSDGVAFFFGLNQVMSSRKKNKKKQNFRWRFMFLADLFVCIYIYKKKIIFSGVIQIDVLTEKSKKNSAFDGKFCSWDFGCSLLCAFAS